MSTPNSEIAVDQYGRTHNDVVEWEWWLEIIEEGRAPSLAACQAVAPGVRRMIKHIDSLLSQLAEARAAGEMCRKVLTVARVELKAFETWRDRLLAWYSTDEDAEGHTIGEEADFINDFIDDAPTTDKRLTTAMATLLDGAEL